MMTTETQGAGGPTGRLHALSGTHADVVARGSSVHRSSEDTADCSGARPILIFRFICVLVSCVSNSLSVLSFVNFFAEQTQKTNTKKLRA